MVPQSAVNTKGLHTGSSPVLTTKIENMSKTEEEKIEAWWDNLNDNQQDWLENKFFLNDENGINTIEKVIHCYESMSKEELLILHGIKNK